MLSQISVFYAAGKWKIFLEIIWWIDCALKKDAKINQLR